MTIIDMYKRNYEELEEEEEEEEEEEGEGEEIVNDKPQGIFSSIKERSVWEPQSVVYAGKTIYWEPFYPNITTNYLKALPRDMTFKEAFDNVDTILNTPYEEADEHLKKVLMTISPKDYVETALPVSYFMMRIDGRKVGADLTVGDVLDWLEASRKEDKAHEAIATDK